MRLIDQKNSKSESAEWQKFALGRSVPQNFGLERVVDGAVEAPYIADR
jgi:hypothetical protein